LDCERSRPQQDDNSDNQDYLPSAVDSEHPSGQKKKLPREHPIVISKLAEIDHFGRRDHQNAEEIDESSSFNASGQDLLLQDCDEKRSLPHQSKEILA
jgi:hypothetical protein